MRAPIDGSVALVTGTSSGIGEELARQLAARVKTLILVARRRERLDQLAEELRGRHDGLTVEVRDCDLTDRAALETLADAIAAEHEVDILVNNAGVGHVGMFDLAGWDKTEQMVELNVRALVYLTHRFVAGMVKRGRGGVLMVSSGFGMTFMPGFAAYVGTKHFVTAFSEALRLELRSVGVVVTQVCPGPVATEFEERAGNPTGMRPQRFVEISAERCARSALAGFSRGRALVIPGVAMRFIMWMSAFTPRWLFRLFYAPAAAWLRKRQTA
jgi:uncharacterized protein